MPGERVSRILLVLAGHPGGRTASLAEAVQQGVFEGDPAAELRIKPALQADADDVIWAEGILLGTPEHFGYMSGALKDFFDRTFYPLEERSAGKPFGLFVSAGNDGQGTITAVRRIVAGYRWIEISAPTLVIGDVNDTAFNSCRELGATMAAGLALKIF